MKTLADYQLDREKIRLTRAKAAFNDLYRQLIPTKQAQATLKQCEQTARAKLVSLPDRMQTAIEGLTDETAVHHAMSEVVHDLLHEAHQAAKQTTDSQAPQLVQSFARAIKPRDLLTVSQWADQHRVLTTGTNAPGQWKTSRTPYLREIMDSLSEHSPVRRVTFQKSSGVGGTEVLWNWIGYIVHHIQNKDAMMIVPTIELRDRTFNPRLKKLFSETTVVGELVSTKTRDKKNSADVTEFAAGSRIIKSGANSPDSLRAEHLPYVAADEIDAYPWDVGGEGDPLNLINNRQRTYTRAKSYIVSTPTLEHESRIAQQYRRSDQREYEVACPECHEFHTLEFKHLQWDTDTPEKEDDSHHVQVTHAWMVCPNCGSKIEEGSKTAMLDTGRWIPRRPHIKRHRGYKINALYAPIGLGSTWMEIAQKWLDAQGDTAELKAFYNTDLGETYAETGDGIQDVPLINRKEHYTAAEIPAKLITAGVDVQKDRLEASIAAWGDHEECWLLDHIIIPGSPESAEVWQTLEAELAEQNVDKACIDAGYLTSMVTEFVEPRAWTTAIKGQPGMDRKLIDDERKRKQRLRYRRRRKGTPIEPIGVDQGKSQLYHRLRIAEPGKNYIHFPDTEAFDEEYFAQLASEQLVAKKRGNRFRYEWKPLRPRNEALDCLIYAFAAMRLASRAQWHAMPGRDQPAAEKPQKTEKPKRKPRRVVGNSEWSSSL